MTFVIGRTMNGRRADPTGGTTMFEDTIVGALVTGATSGWPVEEETV